MIECCQSANLFYSINEILLTMIAATTKIKCMHIMYEKKEKEIQVVAVNKQNTLKLHIPVNLTMNILTNN